MAEERGDLPQEGHVSGFIGRVDENMSHQLWPGVVDPQKERVTRTKANLKKKSSNMNKDKTYWKICLEKSLL